MPEGDSIFRLAAKLAPVLDGREVLAFSARKFTNDTARSLVGRHIESVAAKGKNLLVRFDDRRVLHVHLRMEGRVFVERPRSAFWAPRDPHFEPDLRIVVPGASVVGHRLPVVRLLSREDRAPDLSQLGPDLVREGWDEDEAIRRLRTLEGTREIADALLVQRVAAGIGNVYKSEVLFLEGIHPRVSLAMLPDDTLRALLRRASTLLRRNLGDGPRTTRPTLGGARLWVYGRGGKPCLRCQTPIVRFMVTRSTYFCPRCQPERERIAERASL